MSLRLDVVSALHSDIPMHDNVKVKPKRTGATRKRNKLAFLKGIMGNNNNNNTNHHIDGQKHKNNKKEHLNVAPPSSFSRNAVPTISKKRKPGEDTKVTPVNKKKKLTLADEKGITVAKNDEEKDSTTALTEKPTAGTKPKKKKINKTNAEYGKSSTWGESVNTVREASRNTIEMLFMEQHMAQYSFLPDANTTSTTTLTTPQGETKSEKTEKWPFITLVPGSKLISPSEKTQLSSMTPRHHLNWIVQYEAALFKVWAQHMPEYIRRINLFLDIINRFGTSKFLLLDPSTVARHDFQSEYLVSSFCRIQEKKIILEAEIKRNSSVEAIIGEETDESSEVARQGRRGKQTGTDILKCRKCGSSTTFVPVQTRSGDEGATIFYKCTNPQCGKQRKE